MFISLGMGEEWGIGNKKRTDPKGRKKYDCFKKKAINRIHSPGKGFAHSPPAGSTWLLTALGRMQKRAKSFVFSCFSGFFSFLFFSLKNKKRPIKQTAPLGLSRAEKTKFGCHGLKRGDGAREKRPNVASLPTTSIPPNSH